MLPRIFLDKYIVEPSINKIENDLLSGLKSFCLSVWSKWKAMENKQEMVDDMQKVFGEGYFKEAAMDELNNEPLFEKIGLGTGIYDQLGRRDDKECGSKEVESFLFELECELLSQLLQARIHDPRKKKKMYGKVIGMLGNICEGPYVVAIDTNNAKAYKVFNTME